MRPHELLVLHADAALTIPGDTVGVCAELEIRRQGIKVVHAKALECPHDALHTLQDLLAGCQVTLQGDGD